MATLGRSWIARGSYTVCRTAVRILAATVLLAVCLVDAAAAPVTFRFEATVGPRNSVSPFDVDFDLPFTFGEGDTILGTISVEPLDVPPGVSTSSLIQPLDVNFTIDGFKFSTSQYAIVVRDNLIVDADDVGGGISGPYDEIIISCSPLAGSQALCTPNSLEDKNDTIWGFDMGFAAAPDVLSGADIPGDSAVWNALDLGRGLTMSFREPSGPGIMRLVASVGSFVPVPEPGTIALLALATSLVAVLVRPCAHGGQHLQRKVFLQQRESYSRS